MQPIEGKAALPQRDIFTVRASFLSYKWEFADCPFVVYRLMTFAVFVVQCLLLVGAVAVVVWSVNTMIDAGRAQFWPCAAMMAAVYTLLTSRK